MKQEYIEAEMKAELAFYAAQIRAIDKLKKLRG